GVVDRPVPAPVPHSAPAARRRSSSSRSRWLWLTEDIVGANSAPDHVRLAGAPFRAVLQGGSAIRCPGHLPYTRPALDALHPQPGRNPRARFQAGHHRCDRREEAPLLLISELHEVPSERRLPRVRRTYSFDGSSMTASR